MDDLRTSPTLWERIRFLALVPRNWLLLLISMSYRTFIWGFSWLSPGYLAWTSSIRARRAFYHAVKNVPAYSRFIRERCTSGKAVPEMDKDNYIKTYPIEARCIKGCFPSSQTMIDESSGSTGTPYNWIRSLDERSDSHLFISYFATHSFGPGPWITINAFSMGSWATGINIGIALQRNGIVKNTGPDIAKILGTLRFFGPHYPYLIAGYPPFVKHLIDVADEEGFPLKNYRLNALVGGEGLSEGLRDYLLRRFRMVYSGYGATDLEIGIAGETPLSLTIRQLARDDPRVRRVLFGKDSRLPMVFQYNPLMHHVEVNEHRELVFTITRLDVLSPRIRYNIHDEGGTARYDEIVAALSAAGKDINRIIREKGIGRPLRLPFLWVYGRRDSTISVMGANIYPEDLEQCLYGEPELARVTRSYCLSLTEDPEGDVRPCFLLEVEVEPTEELRRRFAETMFQHLLDLNADFREAWHEYPEKVTPLVRLYPPNSGPFKTDTDSIKQVRLLRRTGGLPG